MVDIFPDSAEMPLGALYFMMFVYGYILCQASQLISEGSEMLLLLYGPGIIGGLVIPILGAIPDCAVILISGLNGGTPEQVQNSISVGVGTLVGSTVMLLTVPWGLGVLFGKRDYDEKTGAASNAKPRYTKFTFFHTCVTVLPDIPSTAKVMILSAVGYFIIQVPSFFYHNDVDHGVKNERPYAFLDILVTASVFVAYCIFQFKSAAATEIERKKQEVLRRDQWKRNLDRSLSQSHRQEMIFAKHDKDHSGYIEAAELSAALADLGLKTSRKDIKEIMKMIDVGHELDKDAGVSDGKISLNEFKHAVSMWVRSGQNVGELERLNHQASHLRLRKSNPSTPLLNMKKADEHSKLITSSSSSSSASSSASSKPASYGVTIDEAASSFQHDHDDEEEEGGDGEEEEEEEEEYWEYTETQLKLKALSLLLLGTFIVTYFSDPMIEVITHVGDKLSISPFYISFVVTPFASNASEVIASLLFARKKTTESISLTLATLHGAATMNNTLALCIFLTLIYARGLSWSYTAEVISVFSVILIVGLNGLRKNIFVWQAFLVMALYPLSILLVYTLETYWGFD